MKKDLDEGQSKEPGEASTDQYDTYDILSVCGEENEEVIKVRGKIKRRAPKFKQYNMDHDLREPKFCLRLELPTIKECQ
ncbi:unnamed protein product [Prunus armeniaca]